MMNGTCTDVGATGSRAASVAARPGDLRPVWWLATAIAACWAVVLFGRRAIAQVAGLYPDALPAQPFVIPEHALLLYVITPVVMIAAVGVLLAPGLAAALLVRGSSSPAETILRAFGMAFGVRLVIHAAGVLAGMTWSTQSFVLADIVVAAILLVLLAVRVRRDQGWQWPFALAGSRRRMVIGAMLPVIIVVGALPYLFWQDLNGDGLEMLIVGHSLADHIVPRFPSESGLGGLGGGIMSPGYAVHWFIMLFGTIDGAARLPVLLLAPVLFMALLALIEWNATERLRPSGEVAVALVVLTIFAVVGLNGRYLPYAADIGSPGATEMFLLVCMAGMVLYLWRGRPLAMAGFAALAYFARPTGLLMMALFGVAGLLGGGRIRRRIAIHSAIGVAIWVAILIVYEHLWIPSVAAAGAPGFPATSTLARYRYLHFDEFVRLAWWAIPAGLLPALTLPLLRRQDPYTRVLAIACLGYLVAFQVPAFVALHHYAPLMVLPVVVFWRMASRYKGRMLPAAALAGVVIGLLSALPRSTVVYRGARDFGRATDHRIGHLWGSPVEHWEALTTRRAMARMFPIDPGVVVDPWTQRVHEAIATLHYATVLPADPEPRYIVQHRDSIAPLDFVSIAEVGETIVLARDTATWLEDRGRIPPGPAFARLYTVRQEVLFRHYGAPAGHWDLDLGSKRFLWRIFK